MTDPTPPLVTRQVTYWAISILNSRTFWTSVATFLTGAASLPQVIAVVPLWILPYVLMVAALIFLWLRTVTIRPVAMIGPGETKAVVVNRIGPPPPPKVGD